MGPPDEHFVKFQMNRLEGLDFKPPTPEDMSEPNALREIKLALMRAKNNREVEQIVTDWLEERRDYPKPADLYDMLYQRRVADGEARPPLGKLDCPHCHGSGFQIITKGLYEAAEPCGCRQKERVHA